MFEHVRAVWTAELAQAEASVRAAAAARDSAQAEVTRLAAAVTGMQVAVDAADASLTARNAELAMAQALVDRRTAERQAAQVLVDQAQAALAAHLGNEPPETVERDKPNPAWGAWNVKRQQLARKLAQAESARDATLPPLTSAQQSRNAAAGVAAAAGTALAEARDVLAAAVNGVVAAKQHLAEAESTVAARAQAAEAIASGLAGLDVRAASLLAEPLDRPALERAADQELADLHAAWRRRYDLFAARGAARSERGSVLAAYDRTMDELAALRTAIADSPDAGRWAAVAAAVPVFSAVLQANAGQRGRPLLERADDLVGARQRLAEQAAALESVLPTARAERDGAQHLLDQAVDALKQHQKKGP
jgi:chromosome segregation ATPase